MLIFQAASEHGSLCEYLCELALSSEAMRKQTVCIYIYVSMDQLFLTHIKMSV